MEGLFKQLSIIEHMAKMFRSEDYTEVHWNSLERCWNDQKLSLDKAIC